MSLGLTIFLSFGMGLLTLFFILGTGFSGSYIFLVWSCILCFIFSFFSSRRFPKYFWLFGICYIALPLLFVFLGSKHSHEDTVRMRMQWIRILLIIYAASIAGGLIGRRRIKHHAVHK